jgi:hypothetical protein
MADLVTPILAAGATVVAAIGGPMVTGSLQNRQDIQLRNALKENVLLLAELRKSAAIDDSRLVELGRLIDTQTVALMVRDRKRLEARRDWSNMGVALFLLFSLGWIPVWMWNIETWWSRIIFWSATIFLAALVLTGIILTFKPGPERPRRAKRPKN